MSFYGFDNIETYTVNLWIQNDENLHTVCLDIVNESEDFYTATINIENYFEEQVFEATGESGVLADLLNHSIREVSWTKIVEKLTEE
jgi:hypothetical protein